MSNYTLQIKRNEQVASSKTAAQTVLEENLKTASAGEPLMSRYKDGSKVGILLGFSKGDGQNYSIIDLGNIDGVPYALSTDIPTQVSQLTNDSNYQTSSQVQTTVNNAISDLISGAPEALDTLNELAAALGDDPNFAATIAAEIGTKVDKVDGKGLSENDFTDELLAKLNSIASGATKITVDTALSSTSTNPVQNNVINSALNGKLSTGGTAANASRVANALNIQGNGTGISFNGSAPQTVNIVPGTNINVAGTTDGTITISCTVERDTALTKEEINSVINAN